MRSVTEKIASERDFIIIGHVSPDGDTLGSGLALLLALQKMGKSAVFVVDGVLPDKLKFMKKYAEVRDFDTFEDRAYGCAIAVDVSNFSRLGRFQSIFESNGNTIVIDHHTTNEGFGAQNLVLSYGATGQIILEILDELGVPVDEKIANLLYAAICTDTGNFTYSNTDESVLLAAARLCRLGADIPFLNERIYRERSFGATRLIGKAIERMVLLEEGKISFTYVLLTDYGVVGAKPEDTDELVNYAREVEGVEIAVFLREVDFGIFKASLRSKKYADVSALAGEFGGGGHIFAAGCTVEGDINTASGSILAAARKYL